MVRSTLGGARSARARVIMLVVVLTVVAVVSIYDTSQELQRQKTPNTSDLAARSAVTSSVHDRDRFNERSWGRCARKAIYEGMGVKLITGASSGILARHSSTSRIPFIFSSVDICFTIFSSA